MVSSFRFAQLPEIVFKNGGITELPGLIMNFGEPVILVTGKQSFIQSTRGKELLEVLEDKGIDYFRATISGEPSPDMIDEIVENHREKKIKLVVAVGGGSVLDAGKSISAMLRVSGSVKEFLEGVGTRKHPGTKLPFIAIPTTSGTGSEATKNAVISEVGPQGFKKSLRHDNFVPDIALLDPELTLDCPGDITAASGMDCFTQLTEAFLSDKASPYTDAFAMEGLKAIKSSLVRSVTFGKDIEGRAGMAYAALNSGICLANAGLGTIHGFASTIRGRFNIPHGLVCGTLMAPANRINVNELRKTKLPWPALKKYAELGKLFLETEGKSDDYYIDGFIDYLYTLTEELNLHRLGDYGIQEKHIKEICEKTGNKNNPVKLGLEEMEEILGERL
jgi:alcohol dehydrogenase class IV